MICTICRGIARQYNSIKSPLRQEPDTGIGELGEPYCGFHISPYIVQPVGGSHRLRHTVEHLLGRLNHLTPFILFQVTLLEYSLGVVREELVNSYCGRHTLHLPHYLQLRVNE